MRPKKLENVFPIALDAEVAAKVDAKLAAQPLSKFREFLYFQKMENHNTIWRFAELVARVCENYLKFPKPNKLLKRNCQIIHYSIHFLISRPYCTQLQIWQQVAGCTTGCTHTAGCTQLVRTGEGIPGEGEYGWA